MNLVKAAETALRQRKVADDFTATFPLRTIQQWREMVREWQENPLRPNPYASNERGKLFQIYLVPVPQTYFTSI